MPDTIIAPASAPGRSAVALVRMSGPHALAVLKSVFQPKNPQRVWKPWQLRVGAIVDASGRPIDTGMAVWMPAPNTQTGEEVAEISCHGSPLIVELLLKAALAHGARLAEPGEFTRRAFLNGKIDLSEAEAVSDIVASETEASLAAAQRQLSGELSKIINDMRENLIDIAAEIEASLDFADDDVPPVDAEKLKQSLNQTSGEIADLLRQAIRGRRLREGARVVLVGRANVGKSSLFNALVGAERAITTPHPGTTRDTIEARLDLQGLPVTLIDTAGIRESPEAIEQYGIERTWQEIEQADLILLVLDRSMPLVDDDQTLLEKLRGRMVQGVGNKSDLPPAWQDEASWLSVSAQTGAGLRDLEGAICQSLAGEGALSEGALVSNLRHIQALEQAAASLESARDILANPQQLELAAADVNHALAHLNAIIGADVEDEILNRIFARFCLGK